MTLTKLKKGNENYQRVQINNILDEADAAMATKGAYAEATIAGAAPTHDELTEAFGDPADLGAGFNGWADGGAAKCFSVMTDGVDWYYCAAATKLAAPTPTPTPTT